MIKRILLTSFLTLLSTALLVGYFYHVGGCVSDGNRRQVCREVNLEFADSDENGIVDRDELLSTIGSMVVDKSVDSIDLRSLEMFLDNRGEVAWSQVFWKKDGILGVRLGQRKPVVRFECGNGRFYSDSEGFLFPVSHTVDVPVVTGSIPLRLERGRCGYADSTSSGFIKSAIRLASFISSDNYWNRQVSQIDVAANGDFVLYAASGGPKVIFGEGTSIEEKFRKLDAYYRCIAPIEKASEYSSVNLKYKNQIICK